MVMLVTARLLLGCGFVKGDWRAVFVYQSDVRHLKNHLQAYRTAEEI